MTGWYVLGASKRRDLLNYVLPDITSQNTRIRNISAVKT
jgi:hypothetical protein